MWWICTTILEEHASTLFINNSKYIPDYMASHVRKLYHHENVIPHKKNIVFHLSISEHVMVLEDGTLVITSATLNTTGIYTCVAENTEGSDQQHFLIEVLGGLPVLQKQTYRFFPFIYHYINSYCHFISGDIVL
jgi:hypothetical protein